ncbi:unnamed protein product, partial [Porites evermanni]
NSATVTEAALQVLRGSLLFASRFSEKYSRLAFFNEQEYEAVFSKKLIIQAHEGTQSGSVADYGCSETELCRRRLAKRAILSWFGRKLFQSHPSYEYFPPIPAICKYEYHFTNREAVQKSIDASDFIESAVYNQNLYGTRWLTSFELYADGKGLIISEGTTATKQRQRAMLLHLAGPDVQEIFTTLTETGDATNYASAVEALNAYFVLRVNSAFARQTFYRISQNPVKGEESESINRINERSNNPSTITQGRFQGRDKICYRCGLLEHFGRDPQCPTCRKCRGKDDFGKVCKTKSYARQVRREPDDNDPGPQHDYAFSITEREHSEMVTVQVGGVDLKMLIDSEANSNIIDEGTWEQLKVKVVKCESQAPSPDKKLYPYASSQPLPV